MLDYAASREKLPRMIARDVRAAQIASSAVSLRRSHPHAPALDVLDLVFKGQDPDTLDFSAEELTRPRTEFGQLIAAALDRGMTPDEWMMFTGPRAEPELVSASLQVWKTYVLPLFAARYGIRLA